MFRDKTFLATLAFSALLHLSMITLFSIEMRYERERLVYYAFDIVDISHLAEEAPAERATLSLPPDPASPFAAPNSGDAAEQLASLPQIALPVLRFSELADMQLPSLKDLTLDPRFEPKAPPTRRDAWSRFGEEIQDLRDVLRNLPFLENAPTAGADDDGDVLRPAPGYTGRIRWFTGGGERKALFAPSPEPQPFGEGTSLRTPVELLFRVDPDGRVTEVLAPVGDEGGLVGRVADALRRYRFEALPEGKQGDQTGTFILAPEGGQP